NDGVVVERKTMIDERAAVAPKTATAHPEILVELLGRCVEGQDEYFPMSAVEEQIRRRVGSPLVIHVDRRRGLGVAVDHDEGHAALVKQGDVGVALIQA